MTSSPPSECTICRKPLRSRSTRHYHEHCQNPELRPFKCDHCERTFASKSHKTFHEETHLRRRLPCPHCDKSYQHRRDLDLHLIEHRSAASGEAAKCNKCSEQFESHQALVKHKRQAHAESKRFKCDQCDMTFSLKGNLTKHAKVLHSKEKRFKCGQCGKSFYRNNALKFHQLNHTSRNFQCKTCAKEFVDARNLERHLKTHVTTKEFVCDICGISSSRKDNVLRHARSFHPECDSNKIVLKVELGEQLDAIRKDIQQSNKTLTKKTDPKPADPVSNRVSVIQVVGTPKPLEKPKPATTVLPAIPQKTDPAPKPPPPKVDPLEIYRKILNPSNDDEDDDATGPTKSPPQPPSSSSNAPAEKPSTITTQTTTQPTTVPTSVNTNNHTNNLSINNFSEVHWRKRTSQIFTNSTRGE